MNNTIKILFGVIMVAALFASGCKKDDDEPSQNYFKYGDKTYNLKSGFMVNYGEYDQGVFNIDLSFVSEGITIVSAGGVLSDIIGNGDAAFFELMTSNELVPDIATYPFDLALNNYIVHTFTHGGGAINYNSTTQTTETEFSVVSGTVTITKNVGEMNVSWDCMTSGGLVFKGNYTGTMQYFDDTKKKGAKKRFPLK